MGTRRSRKNPGIGRKARAPRSAHAGAGGAALVIDEAAFLGTEAKGHDAAAAGEGDGGELVGQGAVDYAAAPAGLRAMLDRADEQLGEQPGAPAAPQVVITVEQLPGLCMAVAMLSSLGLHKIGYAALTKEEGDALTSAVLKNITAWDLLSVENISNPRVAAGLDLAGIIIAIVTPRLMQGRAAANQNATANDPVPEA
jgi:hypothetical protein